MDMWMLAHSDRRSAGTVSNGWMGIVRAVPCEVPPARSMLLLIGFDRYLYQSDRHDDVDGDCQRAVVVHVVPRYVNRRASVVHIEPTRNSHVYSHDCNAKQLALSAAHRNVIVGQVLLAAGIYQISRLARPACRCDTDTTDTSDTDI